LSGKPGISRVFPNPFRQSGDRRFMVCELYMDVPHKVLRDFVLVFWDHR